jgi:hypothetical protein
MAVLIETYDLVGNTDNASSSHIGASVQQRSYNAQPRENKKVDKVKRVFRRESFRKRTRKTTNNISSVNPYSLEDERRKESQHSSENPKGYQTPTTLQTCPAAPAPQSLCHIRNPTICTVVHR